MEYGVALTDETVRGVLLSADEAALSGEGTEEGTPAGDETESEPASETENAAEEEPGAQAGLAEEPAVEPVKGDRVTVYFSGEYAGEEGHELTALEVLIEKNEQE